MCSVCKNMFVISVVFCVVFYHYLCILNFFSFFYHLDLTAPITATTPTSRVTRKRRYAISPTYHTSPPSKAVSNVSKQTCLEEAVTNSLNSVHISPTSNKENEATKTEDPDSLKDDIKTPVPTTSAVQNDTSKTPSQGQEHNRSAKDVLKTGHKSQRQSPVVRTRNSAKKELMSKMVMTRKRLSQENILFTATVSKPITNSLIAKSRIPVRSKKGNKNVNNTNESSSIVEKRPVNKSPHLVRTRVQIGRSLHMKMPLISSSSRLPVPYSYKSLVATRKNTRRSNV